MLLLSLSSLIIDWNLLPWYNLFSSRVIPSAHCTMTMGVCWRANSSVTSSLSLARCLKSAYAWSFSNNNGTYIAQIRRCSKCTNVHQRQTEMFSVCSWKCWARCLYRPQIVRQTVPHRWSTDREAAVTVTCTVTESVSSARISQSVYERTWLIAVV